MLNHRLTKYCENNEYLVDEQNGFRATRSCQDHIYVLSSIIRNRKTQGADTFCAFIDFKKAFDWVSRDLLLYKLSTIFNIHGRLFNTLSTIYNSSSAQIRINGILTDSFEVSSGVKQGDIISPLLFSMYLNDLATGVKELNCGIDINDFNLSILLYADDIVLMAPDENSLQKMLKFIETWCNKWRMAINADKSQIVHFRHHSKTKSDQTFTLGNNNLQTVSYYKYLGVIFDEHLSFEINSSILADSASRALGSIRTKLKRMKEIGYNTFDTLFRSTVLSIADYSAGIWGTKSFNKTEQVQYKAARYFLGVHRFAPTEALLGDMGWPTSKSRHKILILKHWNRLCHLDESRVTKKVFEWDRDFCNKRGTWSYCVKHIFRDLNNEDLFHSVAPCDVDQAASILMDVCDLGDWDIDRYKSQKLRYYNLYKYDKSPEDYLHFNITKYQRSLFAQFRCGILPLGIEVGRYRDIPLDKRLCQVCEKNEIEDEIHFLCHCLKYDEIRSVLYNHAENADPFFHFKDDIERYTFLMSNLQKPVIRFIYNAINIRTRCLTRSTVS